MSTQTPVRPSAAVPVTPAPTRPGRNSGRGRRKLALTGWAFMLPFVLAFTVVFVVPICMAVRNAFYNQVAAGGGLFGGGGQVDKFVGLANFKAVVTDERFWSGMGRVVGYAAFQIPVMIGLALFLALMLDSYLVRRVGGFRLSYFLPYAIPGIVAAMMWVFLYSPDVSPFARYLPDGFDFFAPGTVLASMANMTTWTFTGYNMLIFLAALQAIPHDLYEAARLDGATGFQVATRIKLPILRPAALLAVLLSIVGTIQLFNEPSVLAVAAPWMGNDFTPMMMAYNSMMGQLTPSGSGPASAISIVMALVAGVLAAVYAAVQRKVAD